jgi:hypothetical protein
MVGLKEKTMAKQSEQAIILLQELKEFEDWLGMSGFMNIRSHIEGLHRDIEAEKKKWKELVEISQTPHLGTAKNRFRALIRKQKVDCDLTLIDEIWHKVSSTWIDGVAKKSYIRAEAPMSYKRAELEHESLLPFIIRLHEMCETREDGDDILSKFRKDYLTMGRTQFSSQVYKFVENIFDSQEEAEEITIVPLVEAVMLCRGYYPQQLLNDFVEYGEDLGIVSVEWFNNADAIVASGGQQAQEMSKRILLRCIHRALGNAKDPSIMEENTYHRFLSTKKDCPYGEEWIVQETTKLADLLEQIALESVS